MKKRWKGLCALWMVLALVIGAVPVTGSAEGAPESAPAEMSEAAKDGGGQAADSDVEGSSVEIMSEISSSQTEKTDNGTEGAESEESDEGTEGAESTEEIENTEETPEEGTQETTDAAENDGESVESSEAVSKEEESSSVEETSLEESTLEESSQEEIPETTEPVLTDLELLEHAALSAKAAAAGETAESAEAWLYVGSGEVETGSHIGDAKQSVTVQFNAPFDNQGWSIIVPQNKSLSGWKLWKFDSGMKVVDGALEELEVTGHISADSYQGFQINNSDSFLLIVPLLKVKDILGGESLEMNVGDSLNLLEGTWQVDGDTTLYTVDTGGRIVYAARKEKFTFRKK